MQWHQLDHMQAICISLQITTPAPHRSIFTGRMLFLTPSQQCQSTEGKKSQKQVGKDYVEKLIRVIRGA